MVDFKHGGRSLRKFLLSLAPCLVIAIPAASFAALCTYNAKTRFTEAELKAIECPPPNGYCLPADIGPITQDLINGSCSPFGNPDSTQGTGVGMYKGKPQPPSVSHHTAAVGPSHKGVPEVKLPDLPANAFASLPDLLNPDGTVRTSPPLVNASLNLPQICTGAPVPIPALPCGGAIPLLNSFTSIVPGIGAGAMLNIGNNVFIGTPPPSVVLNDLEVIENKEATGSCAPSQFHVSHNVISLILPPSPAPSAITAQTVTYQSTVGVLQFPGTDSIKFDLDRTGLLSLPEGGEFVLPNGETFFLDPGAEVLSYGDGTIVLPMQGPVPPVLPAGVPLDNPDYYQQSLLIPSGLQALVTTIYAQNILPEYSVRPCDPMDVSCSYVLPSYGNTPPVSNYDIAAAVQPGASGYPQIIGYHVRYLDNTKPLIIKTKSIKSYNVDVVNNTATVVDVNQSIATGNIATPPNATLSIPLGSPITFRVNMPGTLSLPAGATIEVPAGSTITVGSTISPPLTDATQVAVPQGTSITSGGSGDITFPGATTTTIQFPAGTVSAALSATMISVPAGTSLPVNPNDYIVTPQTPGSPIPVKPPC